MATADQIKSLVKAYIDRNDEKFKTVVLQIAAHEAKLGHDTLARDLKIQVDKLGQKRASIVHFNSQNSMLLPSMPNCSLSELIVSDEINEKIQRILNEYRNRNKLYAFGLTNRRKILIEGQPGTGKTFTASVIASELSLPMYTVQMDKLVTKFMGETSVKLRQVFDTIASTHGVYFFDEFDAIGAARTLDNEVGEMRRILNSFLQFIENDSSQSLILAATNNCQMLDSALFRRFDDVLHYSKPSEDEIRQLIRIRVNKYSGFQISENLISTALGLSQAEIVKACDDAIKDCLISGKKLTEHMLEVALQERSNIYARRA